MKYSYFLQTGTPVRQINIHCWSLYRVQDFHIRFHYDHYEHSGQWHGQYRGYKHGRVHENINDHDHVIHVADALEICMAFTWMASVCSQVYQNICTLSVK